eukprot:Colp12_sorted_trinity150504_noHs@21531
MPSRTFYIYTSKGSKHTMVKADEQEEDFTKTLSDLYITETLLGKGAFGKVFLARHIPTGRYVAVKCYSKSKMKASKYIMKNMYREAKLMRHLDCPHILPLYDTFETKEHYGLIVKHATNGKLFKYIKSKGHLDEEETRVFAAQLVTVLAYLHARKIAHRDIKIDNLLLDENNNLQLCDFGLSSQFDGHNPLATHCGTSSYAPPEILERGEYYGPEIDIWSLGVCVYAMLTGSYPFRMDDPLETVLQRMKKGEFAISDSWSPDTVDFLKKTLCADGSERATAQALVTHPFIRAARGQVLREKPTKEKRLEAIERVCQHGYSKEAVNEIVLNRTPSKAFTFYCLVLDVLLSDSASSDKLSSGMKPRSDSDSGPNPSRPSNMALLKRRNTAPIPQMRQHSTVLLPIRNDASENKNPETTSPHTANGRPRSSTGTTPNTRKMPPERMHSLDEQTRHPNVADPQSLGRSTSCGPAPVSGEEVEPAKPLLRKNSSIKYKILKLVKRRSSLDKDAMASTQASSGSIPVGVS